MDFHVDEIINRIKQQWLSEWVTYLCNKRKVFNKFLPACLRALKQQQKKNPRPFINVMKMLSKKKQTFKQYILSQLSPCFSKCHGPTMFFFPHSRISNYFGKSLCYKRFAHIDFKANAHLHTHQHCFSLGNLLTLPTLILITHKATHGDWGLLLPLPLTSKLTNLCVFIGFILHSRFDKRMAPATASVAVASG